MIRTKFHIMTKESVKIKLTLVGKLKREIKSLNKHMTDSHLEKLTIFELINNCHPLYRPDYIREYNKCLKTEKQEKVA